MSKKRRSQDQKEEEDHSEEEEVDQEEIDALDLSLFLPLFFPTTHIFGIFLFIAKQTQRISTPTGIFVDVVL